MPASPWPCLLSGFVWGLIEAPPEEVKSFVQDEPSTFEGNAVSWIQRRSDRLGDSLLSEFVYAGQDGCGVRVPATAGGPDERDSLISLPRGNSEVWEALPQLAPASW